MKNAISATAVHLLDRRAESTRPDDGPVPRPPS
jgi:hypothetical protein